MTSAAVTPASKAEGKTSLDPMYQIEAGLLNVGDAEAGPADGPAVVLLHGWSYDIQSYVDVAPLLAAKGYRVIVPYLCGYGTTHFPSDETFRNGQQSTLAVDTVALMDALEIEKAIVAGFDWGARSCRLRQIPARQSRMPPLTPQRRRPRLRRRLRPRGRRATRRGGEHLEGQRLDDCARPAPVSGGGRCEHGRRVRDRSREVPRCVRRRSSGRADGRHGGDAAGRGVGLLAVVRSARVEVVAFLDGRRNGRQGGRDRRHPVDAERAEAAITEADGSHVIMVSQPDTVAEVILTAAAAVNRPTAGAARQR